MRKMSKKQEREKMIILLVAVLVITIGSVLFGSFFSDAHDNTAGEQVSYKYYKSITIQSGDTLWDLAREYKSDAYDSTQEYIDEIKRMNSLESDFIQEGQCLLVSYYDAEWK